MEITQALRPLTTQENAKQAGHKFAGHKRLPAKKLETLVLAAQRREQPAIDTLCKEFEPMFKKQVKPGFVRQILGYEDALQDCYVFFLEAIYAYKGDQWRTLPGLLQRYVRFRLYREMGKEMRYKGSHYFWLDNSESVEESYKALLEDPKIYISEDQLLLDKAFKLLTETEKEIVYATCLEDKTIRSVAEKLQISEDIVGYQRKKALAKLLKELSKA